MPSASLHHVDADHSAAVPVIQRHAHELTGAPADYTPLIERLGRARFALLGEATHGTQEFYKERVAITQRLIKEQGYTAVAVEADWPDAYRVNRYVRGLDGDADADSALSDFKRFPTWMWRNRVVLDFVQWLREHNQRLPAEAQVGFYGIDLYSLFSSIDGVLGYLDQVDPEAAQRARFRYACFDRFHEDSQAYGYAASFSMNKTCEDNVVSQLVEMTRARCDYARRPVHDDPDAFFFAEQNARLVKNAEAYYRTMFSGRVSSWNLRDQHMVETLQALDAHLAARASGKGAPRMAVWAHNSHLGDASATEMGQQGEWNVGQLMRERYGDQSFRVGFSTYEGTVTAASAWNGRVERKRVRPGLSGSYEALFHEAGIPRLMLFGDDAALAQALEAPRLQRAIGVVYAPQTERQSHYFHARLFDQFNAMIHIDATHGVEPLEPGPGWMSTEAPDTYPSGL